METKEKEHHFAKAARLKREAAEKLASGDTATETPAQEEQIKATETPAFDVEKLIADAVAKALANLPQQTNAQQNSSSPQMFMQPTA